jgi:hypothetical protein
MLRSPSIRAPMRSPLEALNVMSLIDVLPGPAAVVARYSSFV